MHVKYRVYEATEVEKMVSCRMRSLFLLVFCFVATITQAQESNYLSNFNVQLQEDNVIISWTTSADFRCEDLKVEHSLDTINFNSVYTYPGICGTEGKEADYFFVFKKVVFNKLNHFRINLGIYGYSEIKDVHIVTRSGLKPIVTPNPANLNSLIQFANDDREPAKVELYSINGIKLGERVDIRENSVSLASFPNLHAGLYFFVVTVKQTSSTGRFFFQ